MNYGAPEFRIALARNDGKAVGGANTASYRGTIGRMLCMVAREERC